MSSPSRTIAGLERVTVRRAGTIVVAAAAGVLGWLALHTAGVDLVANSTTVQVPDVLVASAVAGAATWAVALLLGARAARPRRSWVLLGTTLLSLSMLGPSYLSSDVSAVSLMLLHFLVGAPLIGGFALTLPPFRAVASGGTGRGGVSSAAK